MNYVKYDKKYSTRVIRAIFLMLNAMIDGNEIDYVYFYDYTGLSTTSYYVVFKIISEMVVDLNFAFSYKIKKCIHITKHTTYYSRLHLVDNFVNYSYRINPDLERKKRIDYSMVIIYFMLKNDEEVSFERLKEIFPDFTKVRFKYLLSYLRLLIDEELHCKNKIYRLRDWDYN